MASRSPISFCLFTSIRPESKPDSVAYLRECVLSWRAAGFDIISVNGPQEAEALKALELPVDLYVLNQDGKPAISTLLGAVRERGARYAGIINSDCRFLPYRELATAIRTGLDDALVASWRLDVGQEAEPCAMAYGLDAFFFSTDILPTQVADYGIGDPWWDLWFPLACDMSGAKVQILTVPIITHHRHAARWDKAKWIAGGQQFWLALKDWKQKGLAEPALLDAIPLTWWSRETLTVEQLRVLAGVPIPWLLARRPQTVAVLPPEMEWMESVLRVGGKAMLRIPELNQLKAEVESIKRSSSWQITRPLRYVTGAIRGDR